MYCSESDRPTKEGLIIGTFSDGRGGGIMCNWSKDRDQPQPRTPHATHTSPERNAGQKFMSDQTCRCRTQKPGAGDAAIAKPTRMQRNQTHGQTNRSVPSHRIALHCSSPRHLFIVLFDSDPARKHIMPTRNEADGFLMRNQGTVKELPVELPPRPQQCPIPRRVCNAPTTPVCWSAVEAWSPDVGVWC